MSDDSPGRDKDAFSCPRCNVWAHQEWEPLGVKAEDDVGNPWFSDWQDSVRFGRVVVPEEPWQTPQLIVEPTPVMTEEETPPAVGPGKWAAARCGRCGEFSVWRDARMVHPAGSTAPLAHDEMPDEARELFDEAREVIAISRRAGAALARASLERLLKKLDPEVEKGDLAKRIELILPRVSSSLGKLLTVIRHAGNKSLHVEDYPDELTILVLDPGEEEIVDYIFTAINNLVDELITRPRKADELYEKVPQSVRDRVDKAKSAPGAK